MKLLGLLQTIPLVLCSFGLPLNAKGQTYFFSAPFTGYTEVDLSFGPGSNGSSYNTFGTINETLYYDGIAQTLRQVGYVTICCTSASISISDRMGFYQATGNASLTINGGSDKIAFDTGTRPLNQGTTWTLSIPVTGTCTVRRNGQTFSGPVSFANSLSIYPGVLSTNASMSSLSLSGYSFSGAPFGQFAGNVGGLGLYGGTSDGTYHYSWQLGPVVALATPVIMGQPTDQTVGVGSNASYSVTAVDNPPFRYWWRRNGSPILGATNASYSMTNVQVSDSGTQFSCLVSNAFGTTLSSNASLVVLPVPWRFISTSMSNQAFNTVLTGPVGSNFVIQVSSNLAANIWFPLLTNTIPVGGSVLIADLSVANQSRRFYRAVSVVGPLAGAVLAWGRNNVGQANVSSDLTNVVAVAAGYQHNLALKSDGTVVGWGENDFNQTNVPVGLSNVTAIAAGWGSSLALKQNGTLESWGWGSDTNAAYGITNTAHSLSNIIVIAAGWDALMALKSDRTVVVWGKTNHGETNYPAGLTNVTAIAAGDSYCMALKGDGTVVAWGDNSYNQTNVPAGLTNVTAIAAGGGHSLARKADGAVVAWGKNSSGQTNVPVGLSNVTAISAGTSHSLALKADGTVVVWGDNSLGQTNLPVNLTNAFSISVGGFHNLAITVGN